MPHSITNPDGLYRPTTYSHVATVSGELVFIAGQFASGGDGDVVSADFADQVRQSFANLRTALRSAGLDFEHVVQLRTHIVAHDAGKLAVLAEHIHEIWKDEPPTQTLSGVAALAYPTMLFEVDAIAARP
ncbi:RidA family protein [Actinomadura sp. GC306]|uniref:RidA family protein n=1 Tax=Actinomadura sp. GC306 TaxID=2530367 RepID=UPI00104BFEDA|nr:RidA family protein [Actinomadura sp. GC306]TDC61292.1 RidA family protein [Actinomadura sp. GC306]